MSIYWDHHFGLQYCMYAHKILSSWHLAKLSNSKVYSPVLNKPLTYYY